MSEYGPPESTSDRSQRTVYGLIAALAVAAFLVGVLGVWLVRGGSDDEPAPGAFIGTAETRSSEPPNTSVVSSDENTDGSNAGTRPPAGSAGETPTPTLAAGGGAAGAQGLPATATAPATSAPSVETSSPSQQGAQTATATPVPPTSTKTQPQQPTATPTRTPTKVAPTATKSATPTKAATATKTATATTTATPTPTPPPTVVPSTHHSLDVGVDDSESVSGVVSRPAGPLDAQIVVSIVWQGSADRVRVVVHGTCTGTGAQHVRFAINTNTVKTTPCNRTLVDTEVLRTGNVPKAVAFLAVVTQDTGESTVQWTITATTLAIE